MTYFPCLLILTYFTLPITAQRIVLIEGRTAHPESLFTGQHLPKLLPHIVWSHDAFAD